MLQSTIGKKYLFLSVKLVKSKTEKLFLPILSNKVGYLPATDHVIRRTNSVSANENANANDPPMQKVSVVRTPWGASFELILPNRHVLCRFHMLPSTDKLSDLLTAVKSEDALAKAVNVKGADGILVAGSTPLSILLRSDFVLDIDGQRFHVTVPPTPAAPSGEPAGDIENVRSTVQRLQEVLIAGDLKKSLQAELEILRLEIAPLEKECVEMRLRSERRSRLMCWLGLGMMSVQFGVLARLTWWEYSWDIMEPVTYFVTYGTSMLIYAYFVVTQQNYDFPDARDRIFLKGFHRMARTRKFDVTKYNQLRDAIFSIERKMATIK